MNVADGYQLWSERYDRQLTDVFEVQDELAGAIAAKLKVTFAKNAEPAKPPTEDIGAYELFLKGRVLLYRRRRWLHQAIDCFQQAAAKDPGFAQAQAALSDALSLAALYGMVRPLDIIERARRAAEQAVSIAPDAAESQHALALWMALFGSDIPGAVAAWDRTFALGGSAQVRCAFALWRNAFLTHEWTAAVTTARAALAADPLSGYARSMVAMLRIFAGDYDGVVDDATRGVEADPESFWCQWNLQRAYHYAGRYDDAVAHARGVLAMSGRHPWSLSELAVTYARLGNQPAARAIFEELKARCAADYVQLQSVTLAAVCAGALDEAVDLLHRGIDERDAFIRWAAEPSWDGWQPLRTHARWPELEHRLKNW